jgi:DNA-binding NarL/FixJ family response regulator
MSLQAIGAKTPRSSAGTVPPRLAAVGITAREVEVLGLLADGQTNAQIATRLVVSVRTVETHVSSLLAKAGVSSRSELRAWRDRQQP